jgi:hypothetical protein
MERLEQMMYDSATLAMDDMSHKLCLVRRANKSKIGGLFSISLITPSFQPRFAIALRNLDGLQQIILFRSLVATPACRRMTGGLFEAFCLQHFQMRIYIRCLPLVRLNGSWHTSHRVLASKSLEIRRKRALSNGFTLDVRPSDTRGYDREGLGKLDPKRDTYSANHITVVDSAEKHSNSYYIFLK